MRAYRGYMDKVQAELAYLQNKMIETMNREMKDDKIGRLNEEIEGFSKEAMRINEVLEE